MALHLQRLNVRVVLADRNSRRLIFSIKQKEKEELVEKKKSLMVRDSWFSLYRSFGFS